MLRVTTRGSMEYDAQRIEDLETLNQIAETLNRATNVQSALNSALARLVGLMGLETGWIALVDRSSMDRPGKERFFLAAHHNLPPGLAPDNLNVWRGACTCQDLCRQGKLEQAYTEVQCSRLASAQGDRRGLTVHASAALMSGDRRMGILNVAGKDWSSFSARSLSLLTMVGSQIGVAVERAQLFDLLRERRIDEQAMLLDFSNQLLSRLDLNDLTNHLVMEVKRLLQADACSLLLSDKGGRWLKFAATSGWKTDPVERKISLESTMGPGWVMQTKEHLVVEDLQRSDPTSWSTNWMKAEGFRGHAIVPLVSNEHSIGVLVINYHNPRLLDEDDRRFLQLMANQAAIAIETARLHTEEVERRRLEEELAIGREIQLSLLPDRPPILPGYEFGILYEAAYQVGGDFYDFCEIPGDDGRIGLIIGDVAGKGVPAALYMAMCRTIVRSMALSGRNPARALMKANEIILNDSQANLFLSAIYASLDPRTGRLTYANAGHNKPLLLHDRSGEVEVLSARGIILGAFDDIEIEEAEIELAPGDVFILYTDGITEANDEKHRFFGEDRLQAILAENSDARAEEIAQAVTKALSRFTGNEPQADDFSLVALKRTIHA